MTDKRNEPSNQVTDQTAKNTLKSSPTSDTTEKDSIILAEDNSIYNLKIIG